MFGAYFETCIFSYVMLTSNLLNENNKFEIETFNVVK